MSQGYLKLEEMRSFFDKRADYYDICHMNHMKSKNIIASFLPKHMKSILDLGIGTGLELDEIYKRFPLVGVTGLDISSKMLEKLKEKYWDKENLRLYLANYFNFELGRESYDVGLSVMTMHHYTHSVKTRLYHRIYRALKKKGIYIECDYMLSERRYENPQLYEDYYFSEYKRLKTLQGIWNLDEYHYDTPCTVQNQKKILLSAGFKRVERVWEEEDAVILIAKK